MADRSQKRIGYRPSLRTGLKIQINVIAALFMREVITRFGRHNIGFLWIFVEPMLFTTGVTTLWYFSGANHGSNLPIVAFALTGYSSVLLWRNMPGRCVSAIDPNLALLFHRQVKLADVFAARILLEGAGATMSFTILTIMYLALGWVAPPEDVLKVVLAWVLLAWFGGVLGLCVGTLAFFSETVDKLWHPLSYLLFPLSGAAFLVSALPVAAQQIILYLPMVHATEMLREGFFGSKVHSIYDLNYLLAANLGFTLVGLLLLRAVANRVVPG